MQCNMIRFLTAIQCESMYVTFRCINSNDLFSVVLYYFLARGAEYLTNESPELNSCCCSPVWNYDGDQTVANDSVSSFVTDQKLSYVDALNP